MTFRGFRSHSIAVVTGVAHSPIGAQGTASFPQSTGSGRTGFPYHARMTKSSLRNLLIITATLSCVAAHAQDTNAVTRMPDVVVTGEAEFQETVQGPFLPPVEGTRINAGKKTSVLDLDELPKINNNNYRQALTKTPGLLLSEETTPLVSIGYRGLNPHRVQFTQVLKDGIPIHADQFGYPEAYYTPPLDTVDRIEFVHGGASLQYGPQPGGALNYVTHRPRTDKEFSFRTTQVLGSDDLYSTFTSVDGTLDRLGYYGYFNHRQTDGFREANSDVDLFAGSIKLVLDAQSDSRWILTFDGYDEEHGEPGGLTQAGFAANPDTTTRFFDRFELQRYSASLAWEKDVSENTLFTVTGWGGYYERFSKRQSGGGFGTVATGTSNSIEDQDFYTGGLEARLRHDWALGDNLNTFAAGVQLYHTTSPRVDMTGATPDADSGTVIRDTDRSVLYAPLFVENRFVFGDLSLTPGLRLESIWQSVKENINTAKTGAGTPLGDEEEFDFVPLLGLGVEYSLPNKVTAYGNVSQAYRPKIFTEAVPTGGGAVANDDLEEGKSWQTDLGLRGQPTPYLFWDASLFYMDFDDQIGTVGSSVENIGHTTHRGAELSLEVELLGLADALCDRTGSPRNHQFSVFGNVMFLDAEIEAGALAGNTPQYAPDYIIRTGGIYRWKDRAKLALTGTFVDDHFANDNNAANFAVPTYMVWDLTLECKIYRDTLSVIGGINNVLDESYYSRVRPDGIDPAYGRNYYAGLTFSF
jgi:Fe(3+) dicitrate transport protein